MNLLQLCKDLLAINSVSLPNGTSEIVSFLLPKFKDLGGSVHTQSFSIQGHENLNVNVAFGANADTAKLMVNTHLDTVSPGNPALWNKCKGNPFLPTVEDHFLYGLGSADTKLNIACALVALHQLIEKHPVSSWKSRLNILGCAGEELGLLGAKHAVQTDFVRAQYVLDSEPTELDVVWAHKGVCSLQITFQDKHSASKNQSKHIHCKHLQGEAAHSSTPDLGKNAIEDALRHIRNLPANVQAVALKGGTLSNVVPADANLYVASDQPQISGDFKPASPPTVFLPKYILDAAAFWNDKRQHLTQTYREQTFSDFDPDHNTICTTLANTLLTGSHQPIFELYVDCRFIQPGQGEKFIRDMEDILNQVCANFPNVQTHMNIEKLNEPLSGNPNNPFIKNIQTSLRNIGMSGNLATKSGCTEAAVFEKAGMKSIVIGPGRAANNIHKPNEKVDIHLLEKCVQFYKHFFEDFCVKS